MELITLGIGTPGTIPGFILVGLSTGGVVEVSPIIVSFDSELDRTAEGDSILRRVVSGNSVIGR